MVSGVSGSQHSLASERLQHLFEFLREFSRLRNPVVREIGQLDFRLWLDELPNHPSIERGWLDPEEDFVLRVSRPTLTECPEPPRALSDWLEDGWQNPDAEVRSLPERRGPAVFGDTGVIERFDEDPARDAALHDWLAQREAWADAERPARLAMATFERLYQLYGVLERERERFELFAGDAILDWATGSGPVHHPLVFQLMQLDFEPALPQFTVSIGDRPPELYAALLRTIDEVDGRVLSRVAEEFAAAQYGPFSGAEIDEFLRGLAARIDTRGHYIGFGMPRGEGAAPAIGRRGLLYLRQRNQGFEVALAAIAEDLPSREDLPNSLLSIVGVEPRSFDDPTEDADSGLAATRPANEDPELLFTKPANEEQAQIARRLDRYGAVMVQGPPGTGKTHTIANLVGHLLAKGKRVLVTSQTAKALERVREEIVEDLRPLAVSVAGRDAAGRAQLEQSVQAITNRLSSDNVEQLRREAEGLRDRRRGIVDELARVRRTLHDALAAEYTDIVVEGRGVSPSDAARQVARGVGLDDWIPGPITERFELGLTVHEVHELYRTNVSITADDEREMSRPLPPIGSLIDPQRFNERVGIERTLRDSDRETGHGAWRREPSADQQHEIERLALASQEAADQIRDLSDWELEALDAGRQGKGFRQVWDELLAHIAQVQFCASEAAPRDARNGPRLPADRPIEETARIVAEIREFVAQGGSLTRWVMLRRSEWARTLNACGVAVGSVRDPDSVVALDAVAQLVLARERLVGFWQRVAEPAGLPPTSSLGPEPEKGASQFAARIQQLLAWHGEIWTPLVADVEGLGLDVDVLTALSAPRLERHGDLQRLIEVAENLMPATLAALILRWEFVATQQELADIDEYLSKFDRERQPGDVVRAIRDAIHLRDPEAYIDNYERLANLHANTRDAESRRELLGRLEEVAPAWASAIRRRDGIHGASTPPGDVAAAWQWRVLSDELDRRTAIDSSAMLVSIEQLERDLQRVTSELVNRLAWASQLERTTLQERQSLIGWMQAMARVGRGTGKRVPRLLAAARESLAKSRSAVPVWIMPINRVVETFDFRSTRFDVVIVDEASQSDVMALSALYLADQVVIVGDHEQVSPEAVGQRVDQFERLIDQFLRDVPNRELYDGRASIYDLGLASFGGLVQLREHFRCVPEIIEFSNQLSYRGSILPLRDASEVYRRPHVIGERVAGWREASVNQAEADFIVSTILAACEFEEYADATFGIISMLEDQQALLIDSMLRQRIPPLEFERRRILVGKPPQFQGDERDVVFLSLVDSPTGGPLPMRQDERFKKRYNVAASRAKDQMWVVHSLDPERDLQAGDLRERIIRHAMSPNGTAQRITRETARSESPFEERVATELIRAGYELTTQYQVGAYRIDLVAHGAHHRNVAIECDGDRYHTLDDLPRDLARQALLERLGWRFVRIRGSEYFRNPDATIARVRERLEELGVRPAHDAEAMNVTSDLLPRVKARAAKIRASWEFRQKDQLAELAAADLEADGQLGSASADDGMRSMATPSVLRDPDLPDTLPVLGDGVRTDAAEPTRELFQHGPRRARETEQAGGNVTASQRTAASAQERSQGRHSLDSPPLERSLDSEDGWWEEIAGTSVHFPWIATSLRDDELDLLKKQILDCRPSALLPGEQEVKHIRIANTDGSITYCRYQSGRIEVSVRFV